MHSPSRAVLAEIVTDVAKEEGFKLNPDAADLIATAADGSFRDALGVTQKVIMASGDKIGDVDEVAAIIGAPKVAIIQQLLEGLHTKNKEMALESVQQAVESNVNMKLFSRVLLDHVRAVMLLRNLPNRKEQILSAFRTDTQAKIEAYASEETSLNSHLLLRLLQATELVGRSPIPHAPLEIAIIDITKS